MQPPDKTPSSSGAKPASSVAARMRAGLLQSKGAAAVPDPKTRQLAELEAVKARLVDAKSKLEGIHTRAKRVEAEIREGRGALGGLKAMGSKSYVGGSTIEDRRERVATHTDSKLDKLESAIEELGAKIIEIEALKSRVEDPKPEYFKEESAAVQVARLCGAADRLLTEAIKLMESTADRHNRRDARFEAAKASTLPPVAEEGGTGSDAKSRPRLGSHNSDKSA